MKQQQQLFWFFVGVLIVLIFNITTACAGDRDPMIREPDAYTDSTGWSVARVEPAGDLIRWNKFENAMNRCPACMDFAESRGLFKAFRRFWMEGIGSWYAVMIYIPYEKGLIVDENSFLVMLAEVDGEKVEIKSEELLFPIGWQPLPQTQLLSNTEGYVYVKGIHSGNGPSSEDFEWARLRSEWDDIPRYYVVAYAKFRHKGVEPSSWRFVGVTSYDWR